MRQSPPTSEMSVPSMRSELLELLDWLGIEKTWPSRVAARKLALITLDQLPSSTIHRLSKADRPRAFRAVNLATAINNRTKG